jgi:heme/copper-type cytochrome/quinol oxidase subunit 2
MHNNDKLPIIALTMKGYLRKISHVHLATGVSLAVLTFGILSFIGSSNSNPLSTNFNQSPVSKPTSIDHSQMMMNAMAQPVPDYPIPDSQRMFSNDTAMIKRFDASPYVLDMAQVPKAIVTGKPVLFVFNLFHKPTNTWLWHSDMRLAITDSNGHTEMVLPNLHGHGSVIEVEYTFPSPGNYSINMIFGQQTGSPNFIVEPKVIREVNYPINVNNQNVSHSSSPPPSAQNIKDISIKAESWKFSPNLIEVNKGDLVRLHFITAQDEVELYNGHGFGIEKYGVNVFLLKGTNQTVEFLADKPGTFTFRCTSFCSAPEAAIENHFNMVGTLVVHDNNNKVSSSSSPFPLSATTIIGNTTMPNNINTTSIRSPSALTENATSSNAFTKENTTAPVSPTGISTESQHAVPPLVKK